MKSILSQLSLPKISHKFLEQQIMKRSGQLSPNKSLNLRQSSEAESLNISRLYRNSINQYKQKYQDKMSRLMQVKSPFYERLHLNNPNKCPCEYHRMKRNLLIPLKKIQNISFQMLKAKRAEELKRYKILLNLKVRQQHQQIDQLKKQYQEQYYQTSLSKVNYIKQQKVLHETINKQKQQLKLQKTIKLARKNKQIKNILLKKKLEDVYNLDDKNQNYQKLLQARIKWQQDKKNLGKKILNFIQSKTQKNKYNFMKYLKLTKSSTNQQFPISQDQLVYIQHNLAIILNNISSLQQLQLGQQIQGQSLQVKQRRAQIQKKLMKVLKLKNIQQAGILLKNVHTLIVQIQKQSYKKKKKRQQIQKCLKTNKNLLEQLNSVDNNDDLKRNPNNHRNGVSSKFISTKSNKKLDDQNDKNSKAFKSKNNLNNFNNFNDNNSLNNSNMNSSNNIHNNIGSQRLRQQQSNDNSINGSVLGSNKKEDQNSLRGNNNSKKKTTKLNKHMSFQKQMEQKKKDQKDPFIQSLVLPQDMNASFMSTTGKKKKAFKGQDFKRKKTVIIDKKGKKSRRQSQTSSKNEIINQAQQYQDEQNENYQNRSRYNKQNSRRTTIDPNNNNQRIQLQDQDQIDTGIQFLKSKHKKRPGKCHIPQKYEKIDYGKFCSKNVFEFLSEQVDNLKSQQKFKLLYVELGLNKMILQDSYIERVMKQFAPMLGEDIEGFKNYLFSIRNKIILQKLTRMIDLGICQVQKNKLDPQLDMKNQPVPSKNRQDDIFMRHSEQSHHSQQQRYSQVKQENNVDSLIASLIGQNGLLQQQNKNRQSQNILTQKTIQLDLQPSNNQNKFYEMVEHKKQKYSIFNKKGKQNSKFSKNKLKFNMQNHKKVLKYMCEKKPLHFEMLNKDVAKMSQYIHYSNENSILQ